MLYGAGAAMGYSPQQVDAMSVWQFNAALQGYVKANSVEDKKLSASEKAALFDWIEADATPPMRTSVVQGWDGRRFTVLKRVRFGGKADGDQD